MKEKGAVCGQEKGIGRETGRGTLSPRIREGTEVAGEDQNLAFACQVKRKSVGDAASNKGLYGGRDLRKGEEPVQIRVET